MSQSQRGSIRWRGKVDAAGKPVRGQGSYTAYFTVPGANGERVQRTKGGFDRKMDAGAYLVEMLGKVQAGTYKEPSKLTLGDYLTDHWLPSLDLRPSTTASYKATVDGWIVPRLGGHQLAQLTPKMVSDFFAEIKGAPRRRGRGAISARTSQYVAVILRKALEDAVDLEYLPRNPAARVKRPQASTPEMKVWDGGQMRVFEASVRGDRLYAAWLVLVNAGLRRGELLGLRWEDVDLDASRFAVRQALIIVNGFEVRFGPPKTARTARIALDGQTVAALRSHRVRQFEDRLAWGPGWIEHGLVFTQENGAPIHPAMFSRRFETLARKAGLPRIRLHDVRHSNASLLLAAGVHPKVVSERLGHSKIQITLDTYSHVLEGLQDEAADKIAALTIGAGG